MVDRWRWGVFNGETSPTEYNDAWSANMLVMWDNRCLVHAATGGYEGHRRLLHRVTIAEKAGASAA